MAKAGKQPNAAQGSARAKLAEERRKAEQAARRN